VQARNNNKPRNSRALLNPQRSISFNRATERMTTDDNDIMAMAEDLLKDKKN
jgi:hypothetical protein